MGKLWMPMNNFKKVSEDQKSATLQHPDGHQIVLAKNILSPSMLQQLAALPMHEKAGSANPSKQPNLARGGKVKKMDEGGYSLMGNQDQQQSPYTLQNPDGGYSQPGVDSTTGYSGGLPKNPEQLGALLRMSGVDTVGAFKKVLGLGAQGVEAAAKPAIRFGQGLAGVDPNDDTPQKSPFADAQNRQIPQFNTQMQGGGGQGGGQGGNPGDPYSGGMKGMYGGQSPMQLANRAYNDQLAGGKQAMIAQQSGSQQAMDSIDQYANKNNNGLLQQNVQHLWQGWTAPDGKHVPGLLEGYQELGAVKQDILTKNIDPNRWFNSGVLPKVVTALGLLGAASNSKGSGAQILSFVQGQMDNDIRSQMADKSGKISVLQANLQMLGNMKDAVQMTGIQHQAALSALLEKAAQSTNNQMAKANYMMYAGQIYNQAAKQLYDWKLNQVLAMNPDGGAGYGTGAQGGGGGAQAGGCGATDATGHPLPRGIPGVNGPMFQQYGPVNMPGGGTRFAGPNAQDANQSLKTYGNLDSDLARFNESQQHWSLPKVGPFETAGRKAKEDATEDVRGDLRDLSQDKRLTQYQQKQIEHQGDSLSSNPWLFGHGKNQQTVKDIGDKNAQITGNALNQDLYGGYNQRRRGQGPKRWNPGG